MQIKEVLDNVASGDMRSDAAARIIEELCEAKQTKAPWSFLTVGIVCLAAFGAFSTIHCSETAKAELTYKASTKQCFEDGKKFAWEDAKAAGVKEGQQTKAEEHHKAITEAKTLGWNEGKAFGFNDGWSKGWGKGYEKGWEACTEDTRKRLYIFSQEHPVRPAQ